MLRAETVDGTKIVCTVVSGSGISDRKGISLPDTLLGVGVLTDKDRVDLDAVLETGEVDWVALSFVQRPEDLVEVRRIAGNRVGRSEEHTSELQSLMRISYAVFCL